MKTKVGLFGIGLDTYWPQFDGLLDHLKGYQQEIKNRIAGFDVEVIDAGMVDNPVKASKQLIFLKRMMLKSYSSMFQHMHYRQLCFLWL